MAKSVIFDCERMKYENTGLYHYCLQLGNSLIRHATADEALTLYCPYQTEKLFDRNCRHLLQTELHKYRMPNLQRYDVWHATYQDSYYLPFRDKRIRVILTVHDLNFMYDDSKSEAKKSRYLHRLQKLINRADSIICVSDYSKKDLLFYCDVAGKPVHTIHNGTNTLKEPLLLSHSYRPLRPFIFSVGTVTLKKNFHTLLPLVQQGFMELVIAGKIDDTAYCEFIQNMAGKMGIADHIKLLGCISENEKSWYFNNCYAFAFPSTAEGFGLPVAEAMSVGKPLFLSEHTALPEIGGDVAFYFKDFSEAHMKETFAVGMKQYVKLNMQEDIIKKGKAYCWNLAAKEYWKIYRSLY